MKDTHLVDPLGFVPRLLKAGRNHGIHSTSPPAGDTGVDDVNVVKHEKSDEQEECVEYVSLASGQLLPRLQNREGPRKAR